MSLQLYRAGLCSLHWRMHGQNLACDEGAWDVVCIQLLAHLQPLAQSFAEASGR